MIEVMHNKTVLTWKAWNGTGCIVNLFDTINSKFYHKHKEFRNFENMIFLGDRIGNLDGMVNEDVVEIPILVESATMNSILTRWSSKSRKLYEFLTHSLLEARERVKNGEHFSRFERYSQLRNWNEHRTILIQPFLLWYGELLQLQLSWSRQLQWSLDLKHDHKES